MIDLSGFDQAETLIGHFVNAKARVAKYELWLEKVRLQQITDARFDDLIGKATHRLAATYLRQRGQRWQ